MKASIIAAYTGLFITFALSFLGAELDERAAAAVLAPEPTLLNSAPASTDKPRAAIPVSASPAPEHIKVKKYKIHLLASWRGLFPCRFSRHTTLLLKREFDYA